MSGAFSVLTRSAAAAALCVACATFVPLHSFAQDTEQYEQPPFRYSSATPHDGIELLRKDLVSGALKFHDADRDAVADLLRRLKIPKETQLLVFSKTSFQRQRIGPGNPRALYFSDECYVGWVPGGLVEVTTIDPVLGPMFYSLDLSVARAEPAKTLVRDNDCMRCHGGTFIRGIPGVLARSVFPDQNGDPITRFGFEVVDFKTPFTNRWGGWYVTGLSGTAFHRGNQMCEGDADQPEMDFKRGSNITNLTQFFNTKPYLTSNSDIVALLVFEQQLTIQNTLTRASLDSRRMLDYQKNLQVAFKEPVTDEPAYDSVKSVFDHTAQDVVDALLFKDEAELPKGLQGSPDFQKAFLANAVKDKKGESLKELDLHGHLFRNRCSYLIYSKSFRSLPRALKSRICSKLSTALSLSNPDARYSYISAAEKRRIQEILKQTAPEVLLPPGKT